MTTMEAAMHARVRRNGLTVEERIQRLVRLLEGWADWQRSFKMPLGYPTRSIALGGGHHTSFDDLCDKADAVMYHAMDAAIESLMPAQRAALMKRYGIAAVFRFPRDNYESQLLAAHMTLLSTLPRRGVDIV